MTEAIDRALSLARRYRGEESDFDPVTYMMGLETPDKDVPWPYYQSEPKKKPTELRQAPATAWPSEQFYDNLGFMPSTIKRYGEAQSFLKGLFDSATLGLGSPIARKVAPDAVKTLDEVASSHGNANLAGHAGGFFANPWAGTVYRGLGDLAQAKGFSPAVQSGLDALSVTGATLAPSMIDNNGLPSGSAAGALSHTAPTAYAARMFMPRLPDEIWKRAGGGAMAGLAAGAMNAPFSGWQSLVADPIVGALMMSQARSKRGVEPSSKELSWDQPWYTRGSRAELSDVESAAKKKYLNMMMIGDILGGASAAGSVIADKSDPPPQSDLDSPYNEYLALRGQKPLYYPMQPPRFVDFEEYADPKYPKSAPRIP